MNDKLKSLKYLIYLPFVGWMLPLAFLYEDRTIIDHIKNAIILSVVFGITLITFSFSSIYIYEDYRLVKFIVIIISLLIYSFYIILCIAGTIFIVNEKQFKIPIVHNYAEKLNI